MSDAWQIGPLVLPAGLLVLAVATAASWWTGRWLGRRAGADIDGQVESALWWCLLAGIVAARAAYVWEFRSAYFASAHEAISVLDIRDGGWNPTAGLVGAWLVALARQSRAPAVQRPLRWALALGSLLWIAGSIGIAIRSDDGRRLPPLALTSLDGVPVRLDTFTGRPTVVNLWATWCGPCVREMPVLQQAQREHPGVHFVFVNQGEPRDRVDAWLVQRGLQLRNVLVDGKGEAGSAFDQRALPTTLFFDARGQWVATRIGEMSRATLGEKLQAISR